VIELAVLPPGHSAGEVVTASCAKAPRVGGFDDEALGNVDCSFERLSRVLRAQAGELSALVIVDKHCRSRAGERVKLECRATVARAGASVGLSASSQQQAGAPAPSAAQVLDIDDPRPQDQDRVRVGFVPAASGARAGLSARDYAAVDETHFASVGRRQLGQLSARCAGCDAAVLRYALRVTAGHVGAGEVAAVKCFQDDDDLRCVATALAPWSS
jgi:hypothetical protein